METQAFVLFFVLGIVAVLFLYFLSNSILDFVGIRMTPLKRPLVSRLAQKSYLGLLGYVLFLLCVIISSLWNMGWYRILLWPLIFLHLAIIGRAIAPNYGAAIALPLKFSFVASALVFYLFLEDGGDIGGAYVFFRLVFSTKDTTGTSLFDILVIIRSIALVIHVLLALVSIFLIVRSRSEESIGIKPGAKSQNE